MKKLPALVLALCILTGACGALAADAGETVEVSFSMLANPEKAYAIQMALEYDHEALELVPNDIFNRDSKVALFNENLSAVFRIREDARPGTYPVTIRVDLASDSNGNAVQFPAYSGAEITVTHPPVEVPVYYIDAAAGTQLKNEAVTLPAGRTSMVNADPPEGWVVSGVQSIPVTVSDDGRAVPPGVAFWMVAPSPTPTPIPGISAGISCEVGSNRLDWERVPGAERYRVYRGTSGDGNYDLVGTVISDTFYTDSDVKGGTTYYYMVEALFPNGQTVTATKSAVAATPMPSPTPTPLVLQPVTGLSVQRTEMTSVTLKWNSVAYAQGYRVMVKERSSATWREAVYTKDTTAKITQLSAGTEYQFKVIAEKGSVRAESGVITAKTSAPTPTPVPVKVGDYISFGHYEQDNNTGNGKEPIEWLVLDVRDGKALLISRYGLDAKPYNTNWTNVTWETCSLRTWLNGEFLNSAFSAKEQRVIQWTTVDNSRSQGTSQWRTSGGKNTEDRIFLLSYAEAWRYFSGDSARQCQLTNYAVANGAYKSSSNGKCWWWLRSPGWSSSSSASLVNILGNYHSSYVNYVSVAIRPALWVDLGSGIF